MQLGLCCCGDPVLSCFQCTKRARVDWSKIDVTHSGFTGFAYNDGDTVTCSGSGTTIRGNWTWEGTQYFKSPNNIPTTLSLWQKPDVVVNGFGSDGGSSVCSWLWNDVEIYNTVGHRVALFGTQVNSEIIVETPYEPVNAADAENPWNRVIIPSTDSRCGTKVISAAGTEAVRWECYSMPVYTALHLRITTVPPSPAIVWEMRVFVAFGTTQVTNRDWVFGENDEYDAVAPIVATLLPDGVTPVKLPAGEYSCFPAIGTAYVNGAGFAIYRKAVDCNADFNGDPVVLFFDEDGYADRRDIILGITCPSTISLTLNPA